MDVGLVCVAWAILSMCTLVLSLAMYLIKNLKEGGELMPTLNDMQAARGEHQGGFLSY